MLTKSQILSRLQNAQGSPLEEASRILNEQWEADGLTVQDMEPRETSQAYTVSFVLLRKVKPQK